MQCPALILHLPSWDAQEPTGLANEDGDLRKRILAQMISVQLLATCFTLPQSLNVPLPSGLYDQKIRTDDTWLNTRLVSRLKQQTQWNYSPAFGHQARNNSSASLWPQRDDALSREALLAEQVSLNRRSRRQREDGDSKNGTYSELRRRNQRTGEDSKRFQFLPSRCLRHFRTSDPASTHRHLHGHSSPQSGFSNSSGRVKNKDALKIIRGLRPRHFSDEGQRCLFEPFLRSESHPVFVQPIKKYVMKRCRVFRSRSRNLSSSLTLNRGLDTRPDDQRADPRTSRDSIQLCRRSRVMALTQDSGNALRKLSPGSIASSKASASKGKWPCHQTLQDPTKNVPTMARAEPPILVEHSSGGSFMKRIEYSSLTERVPRDFLKSPESGPARNRTSTSGTTIYNPPLITQASPDSKKLESDESTSSSTLCGARESDSPHEGETPSTSERDFEPT